ncbi:MAG: amidohydrolase family protein [Candidatus Bathyarchaeia archaeon]|jgi:predicted TIM-barrel fold metal-dependent hydrolase
MELGDIPIVDAHCHIGYFGGWANVGISAEELIVLNRKFNVVHSVVFTLPNSLSAEAARKYPKDISSYVWLNPYDGEKAVEELRASVKEGLCKGVKLHPLFQAFIADDPIVYPIMDEARRLKVPVAIHSGHPPFSLPWSIGELAEVYPDVTIVMLHMGHGHGLYIRAAIHTAKRYPNIVLETSGMPMHTKIKEAMETVGEDRVIYGSDIPFHHPSVELQRVKMADLKDSQLRKLLHDNAVEKLGLTV